MKDKGLGCILRPAKIRNYNYISVCGTNKVELPKTYMIPEENMPLVDDQGSINSCVAHGISKAIEGIYLKNFKKRKSTAGDIYMVIQYVGEIALITVCLQMMQSKEL